MLQKSNLVEETRFRACVERLRAAGPLPADPSKLAGLLVRDAVITFFQAEQLLQGKYKRFSLGKYKVLEKLGAGGMGTVFLCEHTLMRCRRAVKVLPVPKSEDRASLERFRREGRAAGALDHPNIVRAYDIDQDDNLHFLVMEWVDGTNLQDLVKKFGPLDPVRAAHYVYAAAAGLQYAHERGLIHRDIKPGNVLIDRSGVVKILDLGLARITHDTDDQLTRQNDENVLGTADYLAPEQALDSHTVDIRADIYSLGATFYFLLSGSPPFPEGSVAQKLIWHQNRVPRPLKALRPDAPDELVAVIDKMMAKDQDKRYQTPAEVLQALAGWVLTPIPPPAERELPALSPAVAGGQGGNRSAPTSLAGSGALGGTAGRYGQTAPATLTGMPTVISTGATPVQTPAPPAALPAPRGTAVWETLDAETRTDGRGDTEQPLLAEETDDEPPARVLRRGQAAGRRKLLLGAVGAAVAVAAAAVAYFAFGTKKESGERVPPPVASGARRIVVAKAGDENSVRTLREALQKARAGDTIAVADAHHVEPGLLTLDKNRHKDLTIESAAADGHPAVIEFGPANLKGGVLLDVPNGVEGLRLRHLEFDGKGLADYAVRVTGNAPGTTFEGVTVRGVQTGGFYLANAAGSPDRPILLDRVRAVLTPTADGGIVSHASGALTNKHIAVRNSRFEGPGKSGVRFDGPVQDVEVSNNRFYNLSAAFTFVKPAARPSKGVIANNTVCQAGAGLEFVEPPAAAYEFKVAQNFFARTPALLKAPAAIPGLTAENNLYDAASGPGTPPLTAEKCDALTLPTPNPDNDATFLRFPAGAAPTVGPNKLRIGAG